MILSESQAQRAYFDWASLHPHARSAFAVPNGGKRNKIEAARMKAEGVRAGVPDVFVPKCRNGCGGLWLEFKSATGSVRPEQRDRLQELAADGYACAVVYSTEAAIAVTMAYLAGRLKAQLITLRSAVDIRAFVA